MSRPRRSLIAAVGLLVLASSLAPTGADAAAGVYLNLPLVQPEQPVNLPDDDLTVPAPHDPSKFLDVQSFVNGIRWTSWGGSAATGTGTVEVNASDTRPGHVQPYASQSAPVIITAEGLATCGGQPLYTSYHLTLTGDAPAPRDFGYAETRTLPCRLHALSYYAGYEQVAHTTGDCLFHGVTNALPQGFGYFDYCRMRWGRWGQPTTIGTGVGRGVTLPDGCDGHHGECDYGIRVTLSQPAWCPAYGMSYTRERLEVFGHGSLTSTSLIGSSEERALRATIGKSPRRVVFQRVRASQNCRLPNAHAARMPRGPNAATPSPADPSRAGLHEAVRPGGRLVLAGGAGSTVYFNDAGASAPVEPTAFAPASPCCLTEYVRRLMWSSWGGPTATATGEVITRAPSGVEGESPVTVTLGGLSTCGGQEVYSDYAIQLAPGGQPGIDWSRAQRGAFACRFSAGNYRPSKRDGDGGCTFFGKHRSAWAPAVPKQWLYEGFCRMQWVGFDNGPTTTGEGVLRAGIAQWGARVTLSHPAWCKEGISDAIAYTRLTMTIYGNGEPEDDGKPLRNYNITPAAANRLRGTIGKPGFRARTYRYTQSITEACVALGS